MTELIASVVGIAVFLVLAIVVFRNWETRYGRDTDRRDRRPQSPGSR